MASRFGRYETVCPIASGGMATVHLARAVGVGGFERLVAVKVMHEHIAAEPEFVAMFLDEARLAARIRHPNVVATIDVQESEGGLFLVMEYVEGPSLRLILRKVGDDHEHVPLDVTVRLFADVLAGLHAAHDLKDDDGKPLKLVHRDVSPANVLVGVDGVVRLTDFGVARAEARLSSTRGGQLKGKIPYMPPEQILGEVLDRRADVYAAGVVLWETLVGKRPFRASNDGELVHRILTGEVPPPSAVRPELPPALDRVCMKAMAMKPDDRFPTAAAFADALEDAAAEVTLRVASSRTVAAFVDRLAVHDDTDQLLRKSGTRRSRPSLPSVRVMAEAADAPSGPASSSQPSVSGVGSQVTGTVATVSAARAVAGLHPARRRWGLVGAAAALLVAGGLVAVLWLGSGSAESGPATAGSGASLVDAAGAGPSTAVALPSSEPSTSSSSTRASAPTASASASAEPLAATVATSAPTTPGSRPGVRPGPTKTRPSTPAPTAAGKPSSAAGYRPPGL